MEQPDRAFMSESMRTALAAVAARFPVAIISGRDRERVSSFVQLEQAWYAGSHGMDVRGPAGDFKAAPWASEVMRAVSADLTQRLAGIEGASVELNTFCCSAHYRRCPARYEEVAAAVAAAAAPYGKRLRICGGRKVVEIKPAVDWNKGRALLYLLETLGLASGLGAAAAAHGGDMEGGIAAGRGDGAEAAPKRRCSGPAKELQDAASAAAAQQQQQTLCLYFGDDVSDEDAFQALRTSGLGLGVLVAARPKASAAHYCVKSPSEARLPACRRAARP